MYTHTIIPIGNAVYRLLRSALLEARRSTKQIDRAYPAAFLCLQQQQQQPHGAEQLTRQRERESGCRELPPATTINTRFVTNRFFEYQIRVRYRMRERDLVRRQRNALLPCVACVRFRRQVATDCRGWHRRWAVPSGHIHSAELCLSALASTRCSSCSALGSLSASTGLSAQHSLRLRDAL